MNIVERLKDSLEYEYNLSFSERKQLLDKIKDLQQKVEQLEKENDDLKNRLDNEVAENTLRLKEVEQLENIRKEAIEKTKDVKQFVYDELVDRNVGGATETHCKIKDLLNILNKGSDK